MGLNCSEDRDCILRQDYLTGPDAAPNGGWSPWFGSSAESLFFLLPKIGSAQESDGALN